MFIELKQRQILRKEVLNNHAKLAANLAKLSCEKLPQKVATLDIVVGKLIDEQISTLNG